MLHVNKLQDLYVISVTFQQIGPKCIGDQRRHPFFDHTVSQYRFQLLTGYLTIQFMLTAGHRHNDGGPPLNCLLQRIVRSFVTGMERNHHVHRFRFLKTSDISLTKAKPVITKFLCQPVTMFNHICLQIQSRYFNISVRKSA